MNIVIEYDPSVNTAPAGFKTAINAAVSFFDSLIVNPITVPIMFSYGTLDGSALGSGALGESSSNGNIETYSKVKGLLVAEATSRSDFQSIATLPVSDPTNNANSRYWVSDSQAQVFGLGSESGYTDAVDGFVALGSGYTYTFDPSNRSVYNEFDAIGIVEHEISEVLGRVSYLGAPPTYEGYALYSPLDLFRYSNPGVRDMTQGPGYFSADGQNMLAAYNNPNTSSGGDAGDWDSSVANDAFDAFTGGGTEQSISTADMIEMDLLGFQINYGATQGMTTQYVTSGVVNSGAAISGAAALSVLSGGDTSGTVLNGGHEFVFAGGWDIGAVVNAGGFDVISSGGVTVDATVNNGGELIVDLGGTAGAVTMHAGGLLDLAGVSGTSAVVNAANQLVVTSGGQIVGMVTLARETTGFAISLDGAGGTLLTATAGPVVVTDLALNLSDSELDALQANSAINSIVVSDNGASGAGWVRATVGQLTDDAAALSKLAFADGQIAGTVKVRDTSANISADLDALNADAQVSRITVSDSLPITVSAAKLTSDGAALAELYNLNGAPLALRVSGTANDLSDGELDTLQANPAIAAIVVSDNGASGAGWVRASVAQLTSDAGALKKLVFADGQTANTVKVRDASVALSANLDALNANAQVGRITISDSQPIALNVAQLSGDSKALVELHNLSAAPVELWIADNAADISDAALDTLQNNSMVVAVCVSDNGASGAGWVRADVAQLTSDAGALARIYFADGQTTGTVKVRDTSANIAADFDALNTDAQLSRITSSDSLPIAVSAAQFATDTTAIAELHNLAATPVTFVVQGATSDFSGAVFSAFSASGDTMDITDLNPATLQATLMENNAGTAALLQLSDRTHSAAVTLMGQYMAAGFSGSAAANGFSAVSNGAGGVDIIYHAIIAPH